MGAGLIHMGRRRLPLTIRELRMDVVLAIDLGGTKIESAFVDAAGALIPGTRTKSATGREITRAGLVAAIDDCIDHAREVIARGSMSLVGIGVGSAGPVNTGAGTVSPGNLPRVGDEFPLLEVVRRGFGHVPVVLGHDGACIAMAECWVGAAREATTALGVVVSTGVGAGMVDRGRAFGGATGNAGHIGQLRMDVRGRWLEQIASGPASVAWAVRRGWEGSTGLELGHAAANGDSVARAAVVRSARALGTALASVGAIIDFELAAIGGGFSRSADDYIDIVRDSFLSAAPLAHVARARIVACALGDEASLIGSAALIWLPLARGTAA